MQEARASAAMVLTNHQLSKNTPEGINSLAPGKFEVNFRYVIFKWILVIAGWGISSEITLIWTSLDFTNDQSTLVQVMACCRQATSHYLSPCWPRSLSPSGVTRPKWVKEQDSPLCDYVWLACVFPPCLQGTAENKIWLVDKISSADFVLLS